MASIFMVDAFSFYLRVDVRLLSRLVPRLAKGKPLPFGLKTTLSCFCGFAAVLTVHKR